MKRKNVILFSHDEVYSALLGLMAEIQRDTEGKFNIVVIKKEIKHDASGIMDTLEEVDVSG